MDNSGHPIANLTRIIGDNRAFGLSNVPKISAFYVKLLFQEPFRLWEQKKQPVIKNHQLKKDPLFIIGHWRSGTSFLQYLLAQDPNFGYMNKFEVVFPDIFLRSEETLKAVVNQIPETLNFIQEVQNMSINLELDSPSEIEIALTTMISPASLHWGHIFPQENRHYFNKFLFFDTANEQELSKWKHDYQYLIKKTSLKKGGKQLLLKSPGNTCRIKQLLQMYPSARFLFIHRNPYDVFYSNKKLWYTLLDNLALQPYDDQYIEEEIIWTYKKMMRKYLDQRALIPEDQLIEIRFSNFVEHPLKVLEQVYNDLSLSTFEDAKPQIEQFLSHKTTGKTSNYNYENSIIKELNRTWKFAFEQWNYSIINDRIAT
jgi:hypothetical protein